MTRNSTAHWSIGEVLTLLQAEYPEVTISKIRFLESQGLISPERTPSGYRRFYDDDFERLRWILAQQRDNYLPLKVIRDRLETEDLSMSASSTGDLSAAELWDGAALQGLPNGDDVELVSDEVEVAVVETSDATPPDQLAGESGIATGPLLDLTDQPVVDPVTIELAPDEVEDVAVVTPRTQTEAQPSLDEVFGQVAAELALGMPMSDGRVGFEAAPTDDDAAPGSEFAGDQAGEGEHHDTQDRVDIVAQSLADSAQVSPSMTLEELAAESGCDQRLLHDLERFGLIQGHVAIGSPLLFDGEALAVARLARGFGEFGLEPRHLRTFRLAAEREVGLVAQIIEPMMQRSSSDARAGSMRALVDMMELAEALHGVMIRRVTRELLPDR